MTTNTSNNMLYTQHAIGEFMVHVLFLIWCLQRIKWSSPITFSHPKSEL